MRPEKAFALVREANPVADAARFEDTMQSSDAFLFVTKQRSEHMDTLNRTEQTQTTPVERRTRRWAVAVALIALVIAVGTVWAVMRSQESDVAEIPAPPFETPEQAAEAYFAAYEAGDYDAYAAALAADGWDRDIGDPDVVDTAKLEARFRWRSAVTESVSLGDCESVSDVTVTCSSTVVYAVFAGSGIDPAYVFNQSFTIDEEGLLTSISRADGGFAPEQQEFFDSVVAWIRATDPALDTEIVLGVLGSDPLTRPIDEIITDYLAAVDEFIAENQQ